MASTVLIGDRVIDGTGADPTSMGIVFGPEGIVAVDHPSALDLTGSTVIDASDLLIAPGLVDVHGDAFERSLMPRAGVRAPIALALQDNRNQVAASGISTAFLSATDSWEPGLRSRHTLRDIVAHLESDSSPGPDIRLHVRRETTHVDGFDELATWIRSGAVSMLSFADHTPGGIAAVGSKPGWAQINRSGVDAATMQSMVEAATARRHDGQRQDLALASLAREVGCPTASHDGGSLDDVRRDIRLGADVAEFPTSLEVTDAYRNAGMTVLFGAPNLVRGGSHLGNLSVADAVEPGRGDVLCSDYHYPSLLQAPFSAANAGLCPLGEAWQMVSSAPARAAGLDDRGVLGPGRRADIVVVDDSGEAPRPVLLFVEGDLVYQTARSTE